ncbi:nucleotidyltransferase family protein [Telluribacter sp.]|jgi:hypothetical protein|uniref:nucleotidyltransferase family protein n=1 Tax=Telluribacter sp. TaxID=1978767 RepID=UPI002E148B84|nr:nucleotidyltransferase family protein [Telluribacter sp.]
MLTPDEIEARIRALKPRLMEEYAVSKIGYFGSFARGNYHEDSDVDVLVDFERSVGWKFFDLKELLESVLNKKVDLVTERSLRKSWRETILQQVKYIWK